MAAVKTRPTEVTAAEFIAAVESPGSRAEAEVLDALFARATGEPARMWGPSIVGYGSYHYRYDSGHEGDAPRLGFSPRKAELVLYLLGADPERQAEEDALLAQLGKHRTGKSCLYIRRLDQVDAGVLETLATLSWEGMAKRYPA